MRGIRKPETRRIELSGGHWMLVKKHLNAGEQRNVYAGSIAGGMLVQGEKPKIDPKRVGIAQIVEYLLDWSIPNVDGSVIPIRDKSAAEVEVALNAIDGEDLMEIQTAIQKHDADMEAERAAEKNGQAGVTTSSATLESVA